MNSNNKINNKTKMIVLSDLHLQHCNQNDDIVMRDFERVLQYASKSQVDHVLILGDVFDKSRYSTSCAHNFVNLIDKYRTINFYMIYGNHELNGECRVGNNVEIPTNLKIFGDEWQAVELENGNIIIHGISSHAGNGKYRGLTCHDEKFNIAMIHAKIASNNYYNDPSVVEGCKELAAADVVCCGHVHVNEHTRRGMYAQGEYFSKPVLVVPGSINRYVKLKSNATKPAFVVLNIDITDGVAKLESTELKHIDDIDVIAMATGVEEAVVRIADKMYALNFYEEDITEVTGMIPTRIVCNWYKRKKEINYSSHTFYSA